jgi:kynurenine formamidase
MELKEIILPLVCVDVHEECAYSLEAYILGLNHYQIELLANLDQVPEFGAIVVVSFPKPKSGSGSAARVFAILP